MTYRCTEPPGPKLSVFIFQSELQNIAAIAAASGSIETGGDLFGLFSHAGRPVISLATPPGPSAIHEVAHFRQDVEFTKKVARILLDRFAVQYLGNHHSHHTLALRKLSPGDILSTHSIALENRYRTMCQLLVTFESHERGGSLDWKVKNFMPWSKDHRLEIPLVVEAFVYHRALSGRSPIQCPIKLIPGVSPLRQALARSGLWPEIAPYLDYPISLINYEDAAKNALQLARTKSPIGRTEGFGDAISQKLVGLPEAIRDAAHVYDEGEVILISLPLPNFFTLIVTVEAKADYKIIAASIGTTDQNLEPEDVTEKVMPYGGHTWLSTVFYRVRDLITKDFIGQGQPSARSLESKGPSDSFARRPSQDQDRKNEDEAKDVKGVATC